MDPQSIEAMLVDVSTSVAALALRYNAELHVLRQRLLTLDPAFDEAAYDDQVAALIEQKTQEIDATLRGQASLKLSDLLEHLHVP